MEKTLCEFAQGLSWLDYMSKNPKSSVSDFNDIRTFTDRAELYSSGKLQEAFSFLFNNKDKSPVLLSSIQSKYGTVDELLKLTVDQLVGNGLEPAAIDLTTDDVRKCGFDVARAVVPGLETMDGDYRFQMLGGTRWRQVPMTLGLTTINPNINNINKYPHPYP